MLASASASYLSLGLVGAAGGIEAFGQSEALTTRLRHILGDYPEGPVRWFGLGESCEVVGRVGRCCCACVPSDTVDPLQRRLLSQQGVLLELIQNADDAGATRAAFDLLVRMAMNHRANRAAA